MPARIIRDANNRPQVVYVPDRSQGRPRVVRPRGHIGYDRATGRHFVRPLVEPQYYIGLDLGQVADYTALAILERTDRGNVVSYLDRIRGVPYPRIASCVVDLMARPPLADVSQLVVDATGVGRPVIDFFQQVGLSPVAVTITGGENVSGRVHMRVPKRDLINALLLALQMGALRVSSQLPLADVLMRELSDIRVRITAAGNDQYRSGCYREITGDTR
jgi:hypothetical protein